MFKKGFDMEKLRNYLPMLLIPLDYSLRSPFGPPWRAFNALRAFAHP
jgi:hypothetical protein